MDKEPSLLQLWLDALLVGCVGFAVCVLLARRRPWLLVPVLPILVLLATGFYWELNDPWVGPAIAREAGLDYVQHAYRAIIMGGVLPCLGTLLGIVLRVISARRVADS
jgi:hypothetical protein